MLRYKIGAYVSNCRERVPEQRGQRRAQEADGNAFPDHGLQRGDQPLSIRTTTTARRHRPERGFPRPAHAPVPQPQRPRVDLQHQRPDVLLRRAAARRRDASFRQRKRHAQRFHLRRGRAHRPERDRGVVQNPRWRRHQRRFRHDRQQRQRRLGAGHATHRQPGSVTSPYPNEWRFNYANIPSSGTAKILVRLRELSSVAHDGGEREQRTLPPTPRTTGRRSCATSTPPAPPCACSWLIPATDGTVVDSNYVMKVWFSKSLANNTHDRRSHQPLSHQDRQHARPAHPRAGWCRVRQIIRSTTTSTSDYDELAYQLPNLYNGNPDFLHTIDVTYTQRRVSPTLEAFRLVKAYPVVGHQGQHRQPARVRCGRPALRHHPARRGQPHGGATLLQHRGADRRDRHGVVLAFTNGTGTTALNAGSPTTNGTGKTWDFTWSNIAAGSYTFTATVTTPTGTGHRLARRHRGLPAGRHRRPRASSTTTTTASPTTSRPRRSRCRRPIPTCGRTTTFTVTSSPARPTPLYPRHGRRRPFRRTRTRHRHPDGRPRQDRRHQHRHRHQRRRHAELPGGLRPAGFQHAGQLQRAVRAGLQLLRHLALSITTTRAPTRSRAR